jgi:cytochrome P450
VPLADAQTPADALTDASRAAYFDDALGAWVLSWHADVLAALREPRLVVPGTSAVHDATHALVREAAAQEFGRERLDEWRAWLATSARDRVEALPAGEPVDLLRAYAEPWSLDVACRVTGVPDARAGDCAAWAQIVFRSAAASTDGAITREAEEAASALAAALATHGIMAGHAASVQSFVALAHTLPALLASVWMTLLSDPAHTALLRAAPERMAPAVSELLRLASPARAVFRDVHADVDVGGASMRAGDRAVLLLAAANRDAARFEHPQQLDLSRNAAGHLAFGSGAHACAGASLVRLAIDVATHTLLTRHDDIVVCEAISRAAPSTGGFAIRAPGAVVVVLSGSPSST